MEGHHFLFEAIRPFTYNVTLYVKGRLHRFNYLHSTFSIENIKTGMEIEMFIHGAMCASYSGRCVLSNYFTKRDANRGGCSQICRWDFDLEGDNK